MKPSEEFEIHILDDEEFNKLPYRDAETSLGMSVMKTRKAYIRETGVRDLDMGTIRHEFDEMMQKSSPHEIDGVRYKSGGALGKILGPIIGSIIGVFNPAAGIAVGAAISGGTGTHSRSVKPEKYGENTFGAFAKDAAIGGAGAYGGGKLLSGAYTGAANAASGLTGGVGGTASNAFTGALQGAASAATPAVGSALYTSGSSALAGDKAYNQQSSQPSSFQYVNPVSAAFAPKASTIASPLSDEDYNKGLADIDNNANLSRSNVFAKFRGLGSPDSNTAFGSALDSARTSSAQTRENFISDQEERKRIFA